MNIWLSPPSFQNSVCSWSLNTFSSIVELKSCFDIQKSQTFRCIQYVLIPHNKMQRLTMNLKALWRTSANSSWYKSLSSAQLETKCKNCSHWICYILVTTENRKFIFHACTTFTSLPSNLSGVTVLQPAVSYIMHSICSM